MDGGCTMTDLSHVTSGEIGLMPNLEEVLAEARLNSLTRDNPLLATLPEWFSTLRDHQRIAVREILTAYEEGAECVVLDAPTGSGKTLIGETVRRLVGRTNGMGRWATYICSSKALQDQFLRDYPYAKVLKGRSNYATELYRERFGGKDGLSAADCTKQAGDPESCLWCSRTSECPYERAKSDALRSDLAVLNTSYFLSECNGPGRFSRGGLVIADEADELENELLKFVSVSLAERVCHHYSLSPPKFVTVSSSWIEWVEDAIDKVSRKPPKPTNDILKDVRARGRHERLVEALKELKIGLYEDRYVYTGRDGAVEFKPVTVNHYGPGKIWQHGGKWLLMSATVISADDLLESLGWDDEAEWRLVKVPSTFDPAKRKVVVWPAANMNYKSKDQAWPLMVDAVRTVCERHPGDNTVIHSASYELTREIVKGLAGSGRQVFSYATSHGKDSALKEYLATPGGILVGPSITRGIDLPDDACRVQIICKVPFLNLQDKQVSGRLYGTGMAGKRWYAVQALRNVIQATGRGMRHEGDECINYILDRQFVDNLWYQWKRLVPEWWKASIEWKMKGL